MSISHMAQVFEIEGLPPTQKLILLALADHADEAGRCYPSVSRLCRRTGLKERAVQSNIRALSDAGYLSVLTGSGPRGSNVYIVRPTPAADAPRIKCTPAADAPPPPQEMHPPPAADAPKPSITTIKPSDTPKGDFDAFWDAVPRKVGKGDARKAYAKAVKKADPETILSAVQRHARDMAGTEERFIPHPATWLNGERWEDATSRSPPSQQIDSATRERWKRIGERQ